MSKSADVFEQILQNQFADLRHGLEWAREDGLYVISHLECNNYHFLRQLHKTLALVLRFNRLPVE